jgi:hypothetical protein
MSQDAGLIMGTPVVFRNNPNPSSGNKELWGGAGGRRGGSTVHTIYYHSNTLLCFEIYGHTHYMYYRFLTLNYVFLIYIFLIHVLRMYFSYM